VATATLCVLCRISSEVKSGHKAGIQGFNICFPGFSEYEIDQKYFFNYIFLNVLYYRDRTEPDSSDSGQETARSQAGMQEGLFKRYL
jgi:hypothetical protein